MAEAALRSVDQQFSHHILKPTDEAGPVTNRLAEVANRLRKFYGDGKRACFWLKQGTPNPAAIHWGFKAENNNQVDEFYRAAIAAGAKDNISPRARLEYYPGYYAADVLDPDGYSFEVVHKS